MNLSEKLRPWFSALSLTPPTEADKACTKALLEYIDEHAPLENKEDYTEREKVVVELKKLATEWSKWVQVEKKNVAEEDAQPARLFLSGSYRLGINQKGADIDTVLVVPVHITREDFFSEEPNSFISRLRANPKVSHILPISTAIVPIIEIIWSGIELDVSFAQLTQASVPSHPDELLNDDLLLNLDQGSIISLNGPRATELIIKAIPQNNRETFTIVVRALRLWAKRRGLYSNKMGFLGGINFNILAAVACQCWPVDTASRCFTRLMSLLADWKWPAPIRLVYPYDVEGARNNEYLQAWDPDQQIYSRRAKMPIITPAFPNFNSSANVTEATLDIMRGEFLRAAKEAKKVMTKGAQCENMDWDSLFSRTDFFVRFPTYVSIVARAPDEKMLKKWTGYVESRIRKFVEYLERLPLFEIFPLPVSFDVNAEERAIDAMGENPNYPGRRWFVGVRVNSILARTKLATAGVVNLEGAVVSFSNELLRWEDRDLEATVDVSVFKFTEVLAAFPDSYPEGLREAYRRHREIEAVAQKEMERTRALLADGSALRMGASGRLGGSAGAINAMDDLTDGNKQSTGQDAEQAQKQAVETLARRRRVRNHVDLTQLDPIPVKSVLLSSQGSQTYVLFRPQPLKVQDLKQ